MDEPGERPTEDPPPPQYERGIRAAILGVVLGVVLLTLGRRR